jgi:hypothetical protein
MAETEDFSEVPPQVAAVPESDDHRMAGRIAGGSGIATFCTCGLAFFGFDVDVADERFLAHRHGEPLPPMRRRSASARPRPTGGALGRIRNWTNGGGA